MVYHHMIKWLLSVSCYQPLYVIFSNKKLPPSCRAFPYISTVMENLNVQGIHSNKMYVGLRYVIYIIINPVSSVKTVFQHLYSPHV